jgi:ankyrin repeat protein
MFENLQRVMNSSSTMLNGVIQGDLPAVKQAISDGVNIDDSPSDTSYILLAAIHEHWDIVNHLIDAGAVTTVRNRADWTLLHQVVKCGNLDLTQKLLDRGIYINNKDLSGEAPLATAVKAGNVEMVELLMKHPEINKNITDSNKNSALHIAAKKGDEPLFLNLMAHGTDVSIINHEGKTAIDYITSADWKDKLVDLEKEVAAKKAEYEAQLLREKAEMEANATQNEETTQAEEVVETAPKVSGISSIKKRRMK